MTSIQVESMTQPTDTTPLRKELLSSIRFFVILILLFLGLRFGFSISMISGESMAPTFDDGSLVISNNFIYEPEQGDIVIYTDSNGFDVIKRVVGLPGDKVAITNGIVYLNDVAIKEGYTIGVSSDMPAIIVPVESFFLIGDHRTPGESYDSRSPEVGPIQREDIKGEMILAINPFMVGSGN